eukprot:SAG11_NODE_2142_length_3755_cov_211.276805_1_plen_1109_part_10
MAEDENDEQIEVEEFMTNHLAPHLPVDRGGIQYEVFWMCMGIEYVNGKKRPIKLGAKGSSQQPKLTLQQIRAGHQYNDFNKPPLKHYVKASQRAYCWHLQFIPDLVVFDIDHIPDLDDPRIPEYLMKLPYTKSYSGDGYHFYAFCHDLPESTSEHHGVPRDYRGCLINPESKESIGDFFAPSRQFSLNNTTGEVSKTQTLYEKPSAKGKPQYVYNFLGSIPTVPFTEIESMLNPDLLYEKKLSPKELLRQQRQEEKQIKYKPLNTDEDDIARGFSADDVMWMLERIDCNRSRSNGWLQVGSFLRNKCDQEYAEYPCFEDGLYVWDTWSQTGQEYNSAEMESCYNSLTGDEVGFGTLVTYARQDGDEEEVSDYLSNRFEKATKSIYCDYTQTNCAQIMRIHLDDLLSDSRQTSLKKKLYQLNRGGIWTPTDDILISNAMIRVLLPQMKAQKLEIYEELGSVDDDEELQKKWEDKLVLVQKAILNIQDETFQNNVFKQICKLDCYKPQDGVLLSELWNTQESVMFLVPFNNYCYDLKASVWRPALPLEYVSVTTGYAWPTRHGNLIMPPHEDLEFVWKTLSDMFLTENQIRWFLTVTAANLCAQNFFREIYFIVGNAANGKGLFFDLLLNTLGTASPNGGNGFVGTIDPSFFQTQSRRGVGDPNPAVANLRHCRFVTSTEPNKDLAWRADLLKRWNGDDRIECRDLNESGNNFDCQFGLFKQMNFVPVINDPKDPGVRRRVVYVEFPFKFMDLQDLNPQSDKFDELIDPNIAKAGDPYLKTAFRTEKKYGRAFFVLLTRVFKLYIRHKPEFAKYFDETKSNKKQLFSSMNLTNENGQRVFPMEWSEKRQEYFASGDHLGQFINTNYRLHEALVQDMDVGVITAGMKWSDKVKKVAKKFTPDGKWYDSVVEVEDIMTAYHTYWTPDMGKKKKLGEVVKALQDKGFMLDTTSSPQSFRGIVETSKLAKLTELDSDDEHDDDIDEHEQEMKSLNADFFRRTDIDGVPFNKVPFPRGPGSFYHNVLYDIEPMEEPEPEQPKPEDSGAGVDLPSQDSGRSESPLRRERTPQKSPRQNMKDEVESDIPVPNLPQEPPPAPPQKKSYPDGKPDATWTL